MALLFNPSELQASASRRASASKLAVQEEVEWDVNTRPLTERLAPFRFEFLPPADGSEAVADGAWLEIVQAAEALGEPGDPSKGTGAALWSAAIGLARFLEGRFGTAPPPLAGCRVLELGCGTGLVSLCLACLGADVVATDIPQCLDSHTRPNVATNLERLGPEQVRGSVDVRELTWGQTPLDEFGQDWDLVVASDVIYRAEHVPLLLDTLRGVLGPRATGYVAYDLRGREGVAAFLAQVGDAGLRVRQVASGEFPPGFRFAHLGVVELRREPEGGGELPPPSLVARGGGGAGAAAIS